MIEKMKEFYKEHEYQIKIGAITVAYLIWLVKHNENISSERLTKLGWTGPGEAQLYFDEPDNHQLWLGNVPLAALGKIGAEYSERTGVTGEVAGITIWEK